MPGYAGYHSTKRTWSGTTIAVVGVIHIALIAGIYRLSQTELFQDLIKVSKLITVQEPPKLPEPPPPQKEPEPEQRPEPLPESPPKPHPMVQEMPLEPEPAPATEEAAEPAGESAAENATVAPGGLFTIGKGGSKFSGYESLLTAAIQALYQPPSDVSDTLEYAVLCQLVLDEEGYVLAYKLLNSSGNASFDRSAQSALSRLRKVRPPPAGMSRTIVVKFFPP